MPRPPRPYQALRSRPLRAALLSAVLEPLASGAEPRRWHRPFWAGVSPQGEPQDHADRTVRCLARHGLLAIDGAGHLARITPEGAAAAAWLAALPVIARQRAERAAAEARRLARLADWWHRGHGEHA